MRYIRYADYSGKRTRETEEAQFRIRVNIFNAFNTALTTMPDDSLTYANIKAWCMDGYMSQDMLYALWARDVVSMVQYHKIMLDVFGEDLSVDFSTPDDSPAEFIDPTAEEPDVVVDPEQP